MRCLGLLAVAFALSGCIVEDSIRPTDTLLVSGTLFESAVSERQLIVSTWGRYLVPVDLEPTWDVCRREGEADALTQRFTGFPMAYGTSAPSSFESNGPPTYSNWRLHAWVASSTTVFDATTVRYARSEVLRFPEVEPEFCLSSPPPCYGGRVDDVDLVLENPPPPCR